jgi:CHASE2 domain-containing sensor protein
VTNLGSKPQRTRGRLLSWLLLAVLSSLIFVLFAILPPKRVDDVLYDVLARANGRPADASILIVDIDDRSLAQLGAWPWSRDIHGQMIDRLNAAGASTIVYDVLFSQPSSDPARDQALGQAIARSGKVYLPQFLQYGGGDAPPRIIGSIPEIAHGAAGDRPGPRALRR